MSTPIKSTPPFRFLCPHNSIICGSSQSGKSTFVLELLKHPELFDKTISQIYWHYGIDSGNLPAHPLIQTVEGLPSATTLKHLSGDGKEHRIVVIDDLLTESIANKELLTQLWTRVSHHCNISFILCAQSLFEIPRIVRNNSHYMILFKSLADRLMVMNLGRQIFPGQLQYFLASVSDSTERRYGYIIITAHPREEHDHFRLCTDIFGTTKVYLPAGR